MYTLLFPLPQKQSTTEIRSRELYIHTGGVVDHSSVCGGGDISVDLIIHNSSNTTTEDEQRN